MIFFALIWRMKFRFSFCSAFVTLLKIPHPKIVSTMSMTNDRNSKKTLSTINRPLYLRVPDSTYAHGPVVKFKQVITKKIIIISSGTQAYSLIIPVRNMDHVFINV